MKREVQTALGPVWLWGELTGKPVLLIITGAFAVENTLDHTARFFPEVDVLRAHLPGNHSPSLAVTSIGAFASAFTEAVEAVAPGLPLAVVGISTGALVAMGMRNAGLRQIVAIEPPLRTVDLWPLAETFAEPADEVTADFVWQVFGMGRGPTEGRDYLPMLAHLQTPTVAILGSVPLLPRCDGEGMPSLVDEASRAALAAHPMVTVTEAEGAGHDIPREAGRTLFDALRWAVGALVPRVANSPAFGQ